MKVKYLGYTLYVVALSADQQCVVEGQAKFGGVDVGKAMEQIVSGAIDPYIFIHKNIGSLESAMRKGLSDIGCDN